ncbi:uncharacterized protein EKO05_0006239 [Ascochyta rabiei]|uniref:Uncharacterized protein n=1 Tax=Didymella rabiei TaxID=5454 RepID=A0A163B042_DIDRA|nr:uncharacterized protein EKO05_0006239 [Ascochyta rabiei]KZM21495.1 hypothetical protein ST47_g7387 [Ascochyta rabiei]UPX15800.1 hypothetical protein EKO05_0006239 [Ascochyta rabiei]
MAPLSIIGALSAFPLALAHMQMSSPSPLRDPHADRDEPKDYNILSPLNADGSNFACKGYHLNTPLTTVATYAAGSKQTLRLSGSATHGGGSCQIALSCDGGSSFHVMKSIIGGCPLSDHYEYTIPKDLPPAKKCLLSWTWFNKIGNREMYMNCAVVDITNKAMGKRDSQAAAAAALSRYPDLFVANLAGINSCKIQETTDVVFDNPGKQVSYGDGDSASMRPSFAKGQCTGKGSKDAGKGTTPSNSGSGGDGGGGSGQWTPPAKATSQQGSDCASKIASGKWYPECFGSSSRTNQQKQQPAQQQQDQQQQKVQQKPKPSQSAPKPDGKKSETKVQQDLDAYLASLYARGHVRRSMAPVANYAENYSPKNEYSAKAAVAKTHIHTENCKHKPSDYPPGSHYHNVEDLDPYPEDGVDYSNKDVYSTQDSQYHEDADSAYKRTARQKRWASYTKRAVPIQFHRSDESAYYQQQASDQTSARTSDNLSAQKSYEDMSSQEKFEAFLRRMVELSNNMASLVKYAAASTVNIPYYHPASTYAYTAGYAHNAGYDRNEAPATESAQNAGVVRRHSKRGVISFANAPRPQVYPGPSVGSISAPGDATDADAGFKAWFPDLVQGLVRKRQLVDPVTSEASSDAGDSVNIFEVLLNYLLKAFGDPFNILDDNPETDPVPAPESEPEPETLPSGEPGFLNGEPDIDWDHLNDILNAPPSDDPPNVDYPDFEIPDLDGHYTFPPQIFAPEYPKPELLPGYVEGPNGPVWIGEGPDPQGDVWPPNEPSIIISIEPIDDSTPTDTPDSTDVYPGEDSPVIFSCVQPIQQVGFNSCWGGCNLTAEAIAAHDVYLENFAEEQAQYEDCLENQALAATSPIEPEHGTYPGLSEGPFENITPPLEAPDASGRRPRPGHSNPLIPYPLPDNFTGPYPLNSTTDAPYPIANTSAPARNYTELQPYQNKTLGELVSEILNNPASLGPAPIQDTPADPVEADTFSGLTPVPSDSSDNLPPIDQHSNPLQEAADQAEDGVTVPETPVSIDPSLVDSITDALPWFLGPGPVVTSHVPADVAALNNKPGAADDLWLQGLSAPLGTEGAQ